MCNALLTIPDYFYEIPASTTGKYHPEYSLGQGGLVRHTKAAVLIAKMLFGIEMYSKVFTELQQDLMLAALILHDSYKCGITHEQYTRYDHPIIAANEIRKMSGLEEEMDYIDPVTKQQTKISQKEYIARCIEHHMGQWTEDYKGNKVLEKPRNGCEKFVHQADYLASRKNLEILIDLPLQ